MHTPVRFGRRGSLCGAVLVTLGFPHLIHGQEPAPPRPLPPSITGIATPTTPAVNPASGVSTPATAPTAPIARFQNLQVFPAETVQALYGMRAGADWLWRMNQSNGRFLHGFDPTLRQPLPGDHDLRQAFAALALAEAARFTGDERFAARATQSVLALFSLTRTDPAEPTSRVPNFGAERCNPVGFAATLILAVYTLPNADAKLLAQAEELSHYLRKQFSPEGAIRTPAESAAQGLKADPEAGILVPGLAIQALAMANRMKADPGRQELLARAVGHYRRVFEANPHPLLAASLIPGFVELGLQGNKEAVAAVFTLADWLCGCQYTAADGRPGWNGGFKGISGEEPGWEAAVCARALAAATRLTRHAPDLVRFPRYRQATVQALAFGRSLQFSDENADHFDRTFRARFLTGGVHLSPSSGTIRIDATAHLVTAHLAYLQSGGEGRPD